MIREILFGKAGWDEAKGALDAGALRQRVIASNLANIATPGYRAKDVAFEELLETSRGGAPLERTHPGHIAATGTPIPAPQIRERGGEPGASGVNDVSVEREMTELAQNSIHFQALAQMLANRYRAVRDAIRPGA